MAVVSHMNIRHEIIVIAYGGQAATVFSPSMDGDELPESVVISDLQSGGTAAVLQILGWLAIGAERKQLAM